MKRSEVAGAFLRLRERLLSEEEAPSRARLASSLDMTTETFRASLAAAILPWSALPAAVSALTAASGGDADAKPRLVLLVLPANTPAPFLSALPQILLARPSCEDRLLVKVSSRGPLPAHSVEGWVLAALSAVAPPLAARIEIERRARGDSREEKLAREADLVVVFGGDGAVARWESLAPGKTEGFPHRFSLALLRKGDASEEFARRVAEDVALWEQRGCLSPQAVLVETTPAVPGRAEIFCEFLAQEMEKAGKRLPPPPVPPERAAHLLSLRAAVALRETPRGRGLARGSSGFTWTILYDPRPIEEAPLEESPLGRTLWVRPIDSPDALDKALGPLRAHLEAVGILGPPSSNLFLTVGMMQSPSLGRRHGGREPLWVL